MSCREGRADPEIRSAKRTTPCNNLAILTGAVSIPHWDTLSQYTFYGPWIESFQDCWWDPEFPQLSQMVQSLPGFLNLCLNGCSPTQVLGDVYTEVLEAAYSLHRGPPDHKRGVGQQVSLSEVHNQLFSFAHIQRETVVLAPWCKSLHLIQVCGLIIVGNEAQNHSIIGKFDNRCGSVRGHAVICVERVEQGTQNAALRAPTFRVMEFEVYWPTFTTWGLPVRKSWIQSQSEVFRPRPVSLEVSLMGTMVLKAEL